LDDVCGVTDWRIHDLRRTVATGMEKLGITLQVVEAILGHTSGSKGGIVGVYQRHNYADEKRAALEAWGAHVSSLVESR
jgi:integrase